MPGPHRKLAAILIVDAVGYARHMGADEERALASLKARRVIIEQLVAEHGGRVFGGAGDSVVAEFGSALGAVDAGAAMQDAIAELNSRVPEPERMVFRVGINLGNVIAEGDNLFGEGVNVAERLQTLAEPGGICIGGSVFEQVRQRSPLRFVDIGEQTVKSIDHPVRAYRFGGLPSRAPPRAPWRGQRWPLVAGTAVVAILGVVGAALHFLPRSVPTEPVTEASGPPIVAVLPFRNLGGDPAEDYFSDGMTGDVIAALGRFSGIAVLGRNTVEGFRGKTTDLKGLRDKLDVSYVVEGSVRRQGDRIRVTADLTDAARGLNLWSESYDREVADVFAVQDDITRSVVGALAIRVTRAEQKRALAKPTESLAAYDLELRGWVHFDAGQRAENLIARDMFTEALKLDPRYARAWVGLGWTYLLEIRRGWSEFTNDALRRTEESALAALRVNKDSAEAYQLLGVVYLTRGEYDRAATNAELALRLNPSDAYSYATLGGVLLWGGKAEEAVTMLETALRIDSSLALEGSVQDLGFAYHLVGRDDDCIEIISPLAEQTKFYVAYAALAACYAGLGETANAKQAAAQVRRLWPFFEVTDFVAQWPDAATRTRLAGSLRKAGLE